MDFSGSKDAQSDTAEVAVMHNCKFLNANNFLPEEAADWMDDVIGWLTPEQVVDLLSRVKDTPADKISELE